MAAIVGTPIALNLGQTADPAAASITVPSGALGALLFWSYARDANGSGLASVSGDFCGSFDISNELGSTTFGTTALPAIGLAYAVVTSTGAGKSIDIAWDGAIAEGPCAILAFVDGINTADWIRDVKINQGTSTTALSHALTTNSTDLALTYHGHFSTSESPPADFITPACTNLQTTGFVDHGAKLAQVNTPGASSTTINAEGEDYSGLLSVSIKDGVTGSGPALLLPQTFYRTNPLLRM